MLYLSTKEVMLIHGVLINQFGGSPGIRDIAALESALNRPQSGYYKDAISEAAALFESLAINHPFVDGNKRIAFAVMDTFLRLNGFRIQATPKTLHIKIIGMFESGELKFDFIDAWLRTICQPI
ncbi:type II toxin-antitoxin system death-on-curing family toxin [Polynucleobacter sp. MG-28-Ekke-A2]|uniref:type II toxin-antitoxin system death-on-curing family toxin n=1 Tax=Polynucleobacter sp. MG-28-Ekke-A2 TaxID=3108276 RepID=UPI002B23CD77|nr:type II toxin-antitoxin system death-on-curing family toxin [Polynucleobacter sp. MG-28-Ekke-A2]MEA9602196.1 type II toxin-antitoxin system death-on-curing family toxin [Polynucleobacter sp. MG-28-Ekke-A2]